MGENPNAAPSLSSSFCLCCVLWLWEAAGKVWLKGGGWVFENRQK